MTQRAAALIALAGAVAPAPALGYSADWPDTVARYLAMTQVGLENCPELEPDWARGEMPKSTGVSAPEMERRVAAILPEVRKKLVDDTGPLLCPVILKIFGPEGSTPYFVKRR